MGNKEFCGISLNMFFFFAEIWHHLGVTTMCMPLFMATVGSLLVRKANKIPSTTIHIDLSTHHIIANNGCACNIAY